MKLNRVMAVLESNICVNDGDCFYDCETCNSARKTLNEYVDAEEQGLLVKLPCKVGDTIYTVNDSVDTPYIKQENVVALEFWNKNKTMRLFIRTPYGMFEYEDKAFLNREEAGKALSKQN